MIEVLNSVERSEQIRTGEWTLVPGRRDTLTISECINVADRTVNAEVPKVRLNVIQLMQVVTPSDQKITTYQLMIILLVKKTINSL